MNKHKDFIRQLDEPSIIEAITLAETRSSGEIRVFVSRLPSDNPLESAQKQFSKLKMHQTRERNGVLIFFAPLSRTFAIVGDSGIHEHCGAPFWEEAARVMESHLKSGHPTEAIKAAVEKVGSILEARFPKRSDDQNELPNRIARD